MLCTRYIVCILNLIAFVLILVGILPPIPLFSASYFAADESHATVTIWEAKTPAFTVANSPFVVPEAASLRMNYLYCSGLKSSFRALQAFALLSLVLSFFAFLISILQCACKLKVKMPLFLYILVGFICELIFVIVCAATYTTTYCKNSSTNGTAVNFHKWGYKIGAAFILHIVALVVLLVSTIMSPFTQDLWCGNK